MANNNNGNQFRDDEIIILEQLGDVKMVKNIFPKVGGRLRLAHEENYHLFWPPRSTSDRSAFQGRRLTDSKPEKWAIR
jgi:hypothetical protein